ncbi:SAM-dependent methyltransferase [Dactylosporangium sp. CA-152071]|uniref:SAM-dependent methyltransferase n=1 Tax=Dactylosporangium sp. CA-152071 TaxID=3239933 RepID=UPI003D8DEA6A
MTTRSPHDSVTDPALETPGALPRIDTTVAHPARRYNYWLGGKDHFAADRESGDLIAATFPGVREAAQQNRAFVRRAVTFLAGTADIRQFIDLGVGIPLPPNTHETVQEIDPTGRVVYVDNDPIVLTHARALLTSHPKGKTAYLDADLRDPASILHHPDLRGTLDLRQPVGLLLAAVLHFLSDDEATHAVHELLRALAPGSYVVLSHGTTDFWPADRAVLVPGLQRSTETPYRPRTGRQIAGFVAGLQLVDADPAVPEPAASTTTLIEDDGSQLVSVFRWRPDGTDAAQPRDDEVACYGVVARTIATG